MASLAVCELPDSCASCMRCGILMGSWLGPREPAGPRGGPVGGAPAMGDRSRRADGWKLACRVCVCGVRVVGLCFMGRSVRLDRFVGFGWTGSVFSDPKDLGTVYSDFSYRVEDFESELINLSIRVTSVIGLGFQFDSDTTETDPWFSRFDSVSILRGEYSISDLTESVDSLTVQKEGIFV
ncbi:hypothetical protein F511_27738 [Dorcoceras hygrometricum]|uniref:Uncharacterized protein n=1 Tax=Dorcoceras hygrometricum TaxID=472368 RepID=A0A2Z7D7R3_9LAMI|nr:hypothetical protein F511_27738 [Dorcoceras hygrometricum]